MVFINAVPSRVFEFFFLPRFLFILKVKLPWSSGPLPSTLGICFFGGNADKSLELQLCAVLWDSAIFVSNNVEDVGKRVVPLKKCIVFGFCDIADRH